MATAPKQKPLIAIPRVDQAKSIEMRVQGRGEALRFRMFVGKKEVSFDPDNEWMDRSWFGLVVRELDRRKVWHYNIDQRADVMVMNWSR